MVGGKVVARFGEARLELYTCKTDLWQLGMLIKTAIVIDDVALTPFADQLLAGRFANATLAQASLWSQGTSSM